MKKPMNKYWWAEAISTLIGIVLFVTGIIDKDIVKLIGGMFLILNGQITIIHYDGRETDI